MARTSQALVAAIIELDPLIPIDPFIAAAGALVDDVATNDADSVLDATRLELIERWLSAHFYTVRDPRPVSERAGPVATTYQSAVDLGLFTSHYGQMAMTLDTSGYLVSIAKGGRGKARVVWLGTEAE